MSLATVLDKHVTAIRNEHDRSTLSAILAPRSVALVGATERPGSVGRTLMTNLCNDAFDGEVFPVNPKHDQIMGHRAYRSVSELPKPVDLAVVVTPAPTAPGIIRECATLGVKGAVIISAGFKEMGAEGIALEEAVMVEAKRGNMRIIGPNCLGVMNPVCGLNATFASDMGRPGSVGFISQSGAMCTAVLDWSLRDNVGFSSFISIGSMMDVDWGDLIYYLGDDPKTESIVIYMESIGNARSFLSAAREVALSKPIIVIKVGRSQEATKAAASHTGALTGRDEVLDAAFRRCGVLRVDSIDELFNMAETLSKQPRPKGPRLAIVTNAGGPGVLATDALIGDGGTLAPMSEDTLKKLNAVLPAQWSRNNPIDILGDADPARYAEAVKIVSEDPNNDGMLVILTPQSMTDPAATAEHLAKVARDSEKPIIASWMGADQVEAAEAILTANNIPTLPHPDAAVRAFNTMWRYSKTLSGLYETPTLPTDVSGEIAGHAEAARIVDIARKDGRTILDEYESKQVLAAYGIPVVDTRVATTADDAAAHAEIIGYPVVLKLYSHTVTHKTDVGGVLLNLTSAQEVRDAFYQIERSIRLKASLEDFLGVTVQPMVNAEGYELILGSSTDPQFGPILMYGLGGQLVEVLKDQTTGVPPLNTTLARRMMERTKIDKALDGVRGREMIDRGMLELILVQFSHLVVQQHWIKEVDINPLLATPQGTMALDARVILYPPDTDEADIPRHAIRPYPLEYCWMEHLKNQVPITIRPIRPEDEPLMVEFHKALSVETVQSRYLRTIALNERVQHDRLQRLCFIDYDRSMALVIEQRDQAANSRRILGVGRMIKAINQQEAEFALVVRDDVREEGLDRELLNRIVEVAKQEGLARIYSTVLDNDRIMRAICEELQFTFRPAGDGFLVAERDL
jgi:acetyltransferase